MPRRFLSACLFLVCLLSLCGMAVAQQERTPNLLFVFPDQMRMHAMGFWKKPPFDKLLRTETDPVYTPNIDRMAKDGVVFTQATSTHPLCSPHRAMLMSGMYPRRNGVYDMNCRNGRDLGLHHDIVCFTDVLASVGYETAYVGKTHWEKTEPLFDEQFNYVGVSDPPGGFLANTYDTYIPPGPGRHGNAFWFQQIRDRHFDALSYSNRPELVGGNKDGEPYRSKRFSTEVEADVIIRFLENHNAERTPNQPFSIFWAPNPPHPPYRTLKDCEQHVYNAHYRDMPNSERMYRENIPPRLASHPGGYDAEARAPVYYSLITGVDRQLGRVLDALEETGEADNTIVVFTSDHGEMLGSHGLMGKTVFEDESFLVPLLIRYPKKLSPRVDDLLLGTVDIMPTILGLMDLEDHLPSTAEGVDYSRGVATGDYSDCPKPTSALYLNSKRKGVRTDRYTYVVSADGGALVTDNVNDPYQLKKLSPAAIPAEDLEFLKRELGRWLMRAGEPWAAERRFEDSISYPAPSTGKSSTGI